MQAIDYADDVRLEQMVTLGSIHCDIEVAFADALAEDTDRRDELARFDAIVDSLDVELREAAGRVRAIRTLADLDARTAEIAASLNPERST